MFILICNIYKFLKVIKIQRKYKKKWVPKRIYIEQGYVVIKTHFIGINKIKNYYWTEKGKLLIDQLVKDNLELFKSF